ncbi:polysaccharide biosynthesis tyrosine autokinase (plasmid) [Sulfitobacter sp. OXR-159]|uniref:GumC family protein n=1 Tax=Sulfitobacter sp. OXR-159 TaxID=3100174 RepID=UPI002AC8A987|nr:polysaccharide biosynthesis tyrosine autokinase [Sulfitobacter sp. OXR-159]WPZ31552.1 polysaccharide biosynthesis tyrosine autokinase [Sulfitobacter sp. OXR-159]
MKQITSASGRPANEHTDGDEIDLGNLLQTLWRGKLWIALCGFVALCLGGFYAYGIAVPVYTAKSAVALESRQEQVMDIESVVTGLGGDQSTINTEVEVLRSRGLIETLVLDLDLLDDPEFNSSLQPSPRFSIGMIVGAIRGIFGAQEPSSVVSERATLDRTINAVLGALSVSNLRQSFVFELTATTQDPTKSALIANRLAELYIENQISVKFEKTEAATAWLSERVSGLQIELESAQAELKNFSTNTDLINADALAALNRQVKDLRDRRLMLAAQADATGSNLERLRKAAEAGDPAAFAEVAQDTLLDQALSRIEEGQEGGLEAFSLRREALIAQAELETARAQSQLAAIEASIADVTSRIDNQSQELVTLEQLQREVEASRLLYEAFLSRLKETSIQQGIQQADSRLLSRAVVPPAPSAPQKKRVLALSLILGLIVGAAAVLFREMAQNTFRTPEDLEAKTGYSVIGQIPKISVKARRNVLEYFTRKPNSAAAESVRNLRTSLLLANIDTPPKVIMSTSSVPGEGKTTQSIALAQNFAGLGAKVLLIEGDLRRRVLSEYFSHTHPHGFLSVMAGDISLKDAIVYDEGLNADILYGQKSRVNAADLFSSNTFREFIQDLRNYYDYIIIDSPPVLVVPDARVLGQLADAIIYSVQWDSVTHRQVLDGLKSLESVNLTPSGLILSQIDRNKLKRYGYGDSYKAYSRYYIN